MMAEMKRKKFRSFGRLYCFGNFADMFGKGNITCRDDTKVARSLLVRLG